MSIFVISVETYCFLNSKPQFFHEIYKNYNTYYYFLKIIGSMRNTRHKKGMKCVFWVKLCQYDFTTVIVVKSLMLGPISDCAHLSRASVVHDSTNAIPSLPEGECLARSLQLLMQNREVLCCHSDKNIANKSSIKQMQFQTPCCYCLPTHQKHQAGVSEK